MIKPLLSICIPTYNRAGYLKECLESIVCQFEDRDIYRQVEIIISDNASEDNTGEVVRYYQENFDNISYHKHETNLGYDKNVESVITLAKGDFIWTLSDDEYIKPGSLIFLLGVFNKYPNVAWICINNGDDTDQDIREYNNGDDWLLAMELTGGQISQNIYNHKYLPISMDRYFGNLWIHYALAREVAATRPQLLIKNLFQSPESNHPCTWAKDGKILLTIIGLNKIITNLVSLGYKKKTIRKTLRKLAVDLPRQVASAKINGLDVSVKNFKLLFINFYQRPINLLLAIFIFFIPCKSIIFLKSLCQKRQNTKN